MKKLIAVAVAGICSFAAFVTNGAEWMDKSTSIVWSFNELTDYSADGYWTAEVTGCAKVGGEVSGELAIPAKLGEFNVVGIADDAFSGESFSNVTSVTLPASLIFVNADAFKDSKLEKDARAKDGCFAIGKFLVKVTSTNETFTTPAGVTTIGRNAFKDSTVQNVVLSDSVVALNKEAFKQAATIKSIKFGAGITELTKEDGTAKDVAYSDFMDETVERLEFTALKEVPSSCFRGMSNLKEIILGAACERIGDSAFLSASSLTNIVWGAKLKEIGSRAFGDTGMAEVTVPAGVEEIPDGAFQSCQNLEKVTLPDSVTEIGASAFFACAKLVEINVPSKLEKIGDSAFANTKIGKFAIPESVTSFGYRVFESCNSLTNLTGGAGVKEWYVGMIGNGTGLCDHSPELPFKVVTIGKLVLGYQGECPAKLTTADLNGATAIDNDAFAYSEKLTSIDLEVEQLAARAFAGCKNLTSIKLGGELKSIPHQCFDMWPAGENECQTNVLTVTLPAGLQTIDMYAFRGTGITNIEFPEGGLDTVNSYAFANCTNLTAVKLSVRNLGFEAFEKCTALASADVTVALNGLSFDPEEEAGIGNSVFKDCTSLTTVSLTAPMVPGECFSGCKNLTDVKLTLDEDSSINYQAFKGCEKLASLTIPETVTYLSNNCFDGCGALTSIAIPGNAKSIYASCFAGCTNLATVTGGAALTDVGAGAFADTKWLKDRTDKFLMLGGCLIATKDIGKEDVKLDDKIVFIAAGAFEGAQMTSIEIPEKVMRIYDNTFAACSNLTLVVYRNPDVIVSKKAFKDQKGRVASSDVRTVMTKLGYFFNGMVDWERDCDYLKGDFAKVSFRTEGIQSDEAFAGNKNYQGWLKDDNGTIVGKITVKAAKIDAKTGHCKVTATVEMAGLKKNITDSFVVNTNGIGVCGYTYSRGLSGLELGGSWLHGTLNIEGKEYSLEGGADLAKTDAARFDAYKGGVWAIAIWPYVENACVWNGNQEDPDLDEVDSQLLKMANGYCGLSVSAAAKGKVKVTGFMPNGAKVNVTAQMVAGDNGANCVPVVIQTDKARHGGFSFMLWFYTDELGNNVMYADPEQKIGFWAYPVDFYAKPVVDIPMYVEACGAVDTTDKAGLEVGRNHITGEDFTVTEKGKWEFKKQCKVSFSVKDGPYADLLQAINYGEEIRSVIAPDGKKIETYWDSIYQGEKQYFGYFIVDYGTKVNKDGTVKTMGTNTSDYGYKFSYAAKTGLAKGSCSEYSTSFDEDSAKVKLLKLKYTCNAVLIDHVGYGAATVKNGWTTPLGINLD